MKRDWKAGDKVYCIPEQAIGPYKDFAGQEGVVCNEKFGGCYDIMFETGKAHGMSPHRFRRRLTKLEKALK